MLPPPKCFLIIGLASSILLFASFYNPVVVTTKPIVESPTTPNDTYENDEAEGWGEEPWEEQVWSMGLIGDIHSLLGCHDILGSEKALQPRANTDWKLMRDTYREVVRQDLQSLRPPSKDNDALKGYQVRVDLHRKTITEPPVGGEREEKLVVISRVDIPKGTLVWKSTNTAQFTSGKDYRSYIKALPSNLACDVLDWSFPSLTGEQEPVVCVDLDLGSFTRTCDDDTEGCNLEVKGEFWGNTGCQLEFYALRDIAGGEELKFNYDFFAAEEAYVSLGLEMVVAHDEL